MYHWSIRVNNLQEETYGIHQLELRDGAFGKTLDALTGNELEDIRNELIHLRKRIVLYTTDIPVTDTERYVRFFRHAHLLYIENVEVSHAAVGGQENFAALAGIIDMALGMGITLCLQPCVELDYMEVYQTLRTPASGLIFDGISYLKRGTKPFRIMYRCKFKDDIRFLRVADGEEDGGKPTPLGMGNGDIRECISNLLVRNYRGYFSFTDYSGDIQTILRDFESIVTEI